ncbi:MAG: competence/damage-inducible protein A [Bacteroidota bacterium]
MKAYLISIGDELLNGQTVNTNAAYIGERLFQNQVEVLKTAVIGDNEESILAEFSDAINSADLIIVTGGLGPTHDDVTRKSVVKFFDSELILNNDVLMDITDLFTRRGREVTPSNKDQAFVPKICETIRNYSGTAPGYWILKDKKIFVVVPGVPHEMKEMMENFVMPRISNILGDEHRKSHTTNLLTTGIPESFLFEKLGSIEDLVKGGKMAFLPSQFGVKLRITSTGETEEEAKDKLIEIEQQIRSIAGRYIYGKNDETLESVIARLLIDRGLTVSVAESCTGGLISSRLTNVSGSSDYFQRGFITYSNGAKVELLHIDEDMINKYGAVSLDVARLMADGVRAVSGTDIGLAATGIMGPTGATQDKPVGLVYIGICDDKICTARKFKFGEDRLLNKDRTAQAALEMLRRNLLGIPYEE